MDALRTQTGSLTRSVRARVIIVRISKLLAMVGLGLALAGCDMGVLDPRGPVGVAERLILIDSLAIMLVIVLPVLFATIGVAWWFRASNTRAFYLPDWEFNGTLELVVWSIPILIIVVLGGVSWFGSHALDPYKPLPLADGTKAVEVQAVALDWKWLFIYPDEGVATVNQLYLPTGRPVHFSITSATVWNTLFIPQLGGMIYAMAGMTTQLHLQADQTGTYRGLSGMFSGEGFSDMHFDVRAVKGDDYAKWVETTKASGNALDTKAYADLAQSAAFAPVSTYKSVEPNLFGSIVSLTAPSPSGAPNVTNPP